MTMFFLVIALVASGFLAIQMLMLIFGVDMDFDADVDVDAGDIDGFLSIRSLTAFFGGFGWAGLAALQAGWSGGAAIVTGLAVGIGFFFLTGLLFIQIRRLETTGNTDLNRIVGEPGTVYLTIPSHRSGSGKVEVVVGGTLSTIDAMTQGESDIPAKARVRVVATIDANTLLVEAL
jgi:hypothetical protein